MRKELVEEQVYWILIYVQEETTDMQKKNVLADWEFLLAGELLVGLKKKFRGEDDKSTKVVELKQLK